MRRPPLRIAIPESVDAVMLAQVLVGPDVLIKAVVHKDWRTRPFHRYDAMNNQYDQIVTMYRTQVKRMVAAIVRKVEANDPSLRKADPPKGYRPLMTPQQLQEIAQIIRDYHTAIVASIAPDQITPEQVQAMIDAGIMPPEARDVMKDAYLYGHLMATIRSMGTPARVASMTYPEFRERIERKPIATTPHEDEAIAWARHSAAVHVRGLGNKIADDFSTIAIEADANLRKRYEDTIREKLEENIDRRDTWRDLASELGHATEDWSRDFGRIAATEKQRAMQEGFSEGLIKKHGSANAVLVSKVPAAGACKHCVALHLTSGEGSPPKVFPLQELRANGSNVGRKAADWKPVVGTVHPWCFPAGTPIETENGFGTPIEAVHVGTLVTTHLGRLRAVQRLSKRRHRGDLVVLRVGEELLKTTPEHPLLTQRGWVAAGSIEDGDRLMQVAQLPAGSADANDTPPEDVEVRVLRAVLGSLVRRGVPSGVDLDGNAQIGESDVHAVRAYRELWRTAMARAYEAFECLPLVGRHRTAVLSGLGRLHLLRSGPGLPADGIVGSLRTALSLIRVGLCGLDEELLAHRTDPDAGGDEARGDGAPRGSVDVRNVLHALAAIVSGDDTFDVELQGLCHTQVHYHGAPVTSIEREAFDGFVYNFSVEEDESYVAHGFVVHNCQCELVEVPAGWGWEDKPEEGAGWEPVTNRDGAFRKRRPGTEEDDDNAWIYWSPDLMPETTRKSAIAFARDLRKALAQPAWLGYGDGVGERGVAIRVADPRVHMAVKRVIDATPPQIFHKRIGITMVTTDHPRAQVALTDHDLAYWTGNEVRLSQHLPAEKVEHVLTHEIGHSLNVYLIHELGGIDAVRAWHEKLDAVSKREGYVSEYAKVLPIENAAEATKLYIYAPRQMQREYPKQYEFLRDAYREVLDQGARAA